eukprot:gene1446-1467_t
MTWNELIALFAFIGVCAAAATSGAVFKPGVWYDRLAKPSWVPPMWLFPVAWTLLYVMISVSGWLVWKEAGLAGAAAAFVIYGVQLALNAGWRCCGRRSWRPSRLSRCIRIWRPGCWRRISPG